MSSRWRVWRSRDWLNKKGVPGPAGRNSADAMSTHVCGRLIDESIAQRAAKLFKPGIGIAAMKDKWTEVGIQIRRDEVDLGIGRTTVWAGERMDLDVAGKHIVHTLWEPQAHAIKDYWATDFRGDVIEIPPAELQQQAIAFHGRWRKLWMPQSAHPAFGRGKFDRRQISTLCGFQLPSHSTVVL